MYSLFSLLTESSIICGCVWTIGHILWLFISSFNTTHIIHYNSIKFSVWRMDTYKQFCCFFIHLSEYCQQFILIYLLHAISDWLEGISPSQCEKMCLNFTLVLIWRVSQKKSFNTFLLMSEQYSSYSIVVRGRGGAIKYAISHQDRDAPIFTTRTFLSVMKARYL